MKVTVPLPALVLPALTRSQGALAIELHGQSAALALTEMLAPVKPPGGTTTLLGETLSEQTTPLWLMVRLCPAIQIVPVREADEGLGLTV